MTTTLTSLPLYLNSNTLKHNAWDLRRFMDGDPPGPGVADYESYRAMQRQAGANLSVDIGKTGVGLMQAWVRGSTRDGQGLYRCDNVDPTAPTANTFLAQFNEAGFTAADPTNPRIDQVILQIVDQQHAGGSNLLQSSVVTGTPTGGATLDNRTGAAALPASCVLLADILIPAAATTVVTANIQDRRPFPLYGTVPPILTALDAVTLIPHPGMPLGMATICSQGSFDQYQTAVLFYLPRRIVGATKIRFKYRQGPTAANNAGLVAMFDASGRAIPNANGTHAYTGALNTTQVGVVTITATTFEPGCYYVFYSNNAATAGTSATAFGPILSVGSLSDPSIPANVALVKSSGGNTLPNRLTVAGGFTDDLATAADLGLPGVPIITLSVG